MSRQPTPNIDYTSRDYEAYRELLIQKLLEKFPQYTDTTETDVGIVILEAFANGLDIISLYSDIIANDMLLQTTQSRRIADLLARCLGYIPRNQTASEYRQVFVLSDIRDDDTLIPAGTVVKTPDDDDVETQYYQTVSDFVIPAGYRGDEQEDGEYKFTTKIVAGEYISQDILGSSSGAPLESFKLSYIEVIPDSIEIYVDEGSGEDLWTQVTSFFDSDENSKVYVVSVNEYDECTIQFGNGIKGKIPAAYPNGIIANYRIGGGLASNVAAGIISELSSSVSYVDSTFNLDVDVRGHGKEDLESIKINAPAYYRTRDRLVTLEDYEDLLRINFYDFLEIKAIRDDINKLHVHLWYLMREDYTLNASLVQRVAEYIGKRSMIGTSYDLNAVTYEVVNLSANLYVDADYDAVTIESNVRGYLTNTIFYLGQLSFGESIVKTDVEEEIISTFEGIVSFRINSPNVDIISPSNEHSILSIGTITITTTTV